MALSKNSLYTVCGITTDAQGTTKVRWTQDIIRRTKLFLKEGYTRIDLVNLPQPMSKIDALAYIRELPQFSNVGDQMVIDDATEYRLLAKSKSDGTYVPRPRGRPRKSTNTVTVNGKKAKKILSLEDIKSRVKTEDSQVFDVLSAVGILV